MSWRGNAESVLQRAWLGRGPLAILLLPLAAIYGLAIALRRRLYRSGLLRSRAAAVPVVVIGNLFVGGTGKTPVVMALVQALRARGWRPGVVSRGYGGTGSGALSVQSTSDANEVGDEPLLVVSTTGVPVVVGRDRVAACALLLRESDCNVIVSDDGLQHLRLRRAVEIAVFDERGFGNGWLLPAGPLRESSARLAEVDAVVVRGEALVESTSQAPRFALHAHLGPARPLAGGGEVPLNQLAALQKTQALRITAAAGIGNPGRFFAMLRDAGLQIGTLPLPDHASFNAESFANIAAERILITEKDAVKCAAIPALLQDGRLWVVPLVTELDPRLVDLVEARLQHRDKEPPRGPSTA